MRSGRTYDLAVIGGGVNGCGIARDAQGRGLSVFLGEQGDLAGATSSASTKLIHGGLRYLEYLRVPAGPRGADRARGAARLRAAHHLAAALCPPSSQRPAAVAGRPARPLSLRPSRRPRHPAADAQPRSRGRTRPGKPLKPAYHRAFEYSDCWVDDARLVALNARDAADRGADIADPHPVRRGPARRAANGG